MPQLEVELAQLKEVKSGLQKRNTDLRREVARIAALPEPAAAGPAAACWLRTPTRVGDGEDEMGHIAQTDEPEGLAPITPLEATHARPLLEPLELSLSDDPARAHLCSRYAGLDLDLDCPALDRSIAIWISASRDLGYVEPPSPDGNLVPISTYAASSTLHIDAASAFVVDIENEISGWHSRLGAAPPRRGGRVAGQRGAGRWKHRQW